MMVVIVLMMSCHVLTSRKTRNVGAQMTTRRTHTVKNAARLAILDDQPAKRSNTPTREETSLGARARKRRLRRARARPARLRRAQRLDARRQVPLRLGSRLRDDGGHRPARAQSLGLA